MNLGDNPEYQRENNSEEIVHKPEENNSENEDQKPNYEYVDEDGNPIDPSEMEEYEVVDENDEGDENEPEEEGEEEYVDEDGNPIDPSEMEEYEVVDENESEEEGEEEYVDKPEQQNKDSQEQTLSAQESEEILEDIKDISGINIEQTKDQYQSIVQETIQTPIEEPQQTSIEHELIQEQPQNYTNESFQEGMTQETIQPEEIIEREPIQEEIKINQEEVIQEFISPVIEEPSLQAYEPPIQIQSEITSGPIQEEVTQETIQTPVEEPQQTVVQQIQEQPQEDLDFKRKQEELIRTISTGKKPEESDLDIFIKQAQDSQQEITHKREEPVQEMSKRSTEIYQPSVPVQEKPQAYESHEPIQEEVTQETIQTPVEEPQKTVEEPIQEEKQETNEDLLQKLSMSNKSTPEVAPEKTNGDDSIENPYIYRKGHPHLGANFSMDTISNLANKIFNTDEAVDKLNKNKKK